MGNRFASCILASCLLTSVAAFSSPAAAHAQASEMDEQGRRLFVAGTNAYQAGRYEEALEYFRAAHQLSHRGPLLYNIGVAAERLGDREQALEAFERYLNEVPDAPNRVEVETRIRVLRSRTEAEDEPVVVVSPEETEERTAEEADAPEPEAEESTPGPGAGPWVLVGGGGAVAVVGVVLYALGAGDRKDVEGADPGTPWTELEGAYDRAPTRLGAGAAMMAVGVACVAGGIVWRVVGEPSEPESTDVAVTVGPSRIGVRVRF